MVRGKKIWQSYDEITSNSEDFIAIGHDYEQKIGHQPTTIAGAPTKIFEMRGLVDYVSGIISE